MPPCYTAFQGGCKSKQKLEAWCMCLLPVQWEGLIALPTAHLDCIFSDLFSISHFEKGLLNAQDYILAQFFRPKSNNLLTWFLINYVYFSKRIANNLKYMKYVHCPFTLDQKSYNIVRVLQFFSYQDFLWDSFSSLCSANDGICPKALWCI